MTPGAPAGVVAGPNEREFPYEARHFEVLRRLAKEIAGIDLADHKRELVYGRIARRIRDLHLASFDEYCALVTPAGSPERSNFINAITTNVTSFFREGHHFEHLRTEALPELMRARSTTRRLRIWSSACSTGQEPYSIAITTARALEAHPGWDCKILATDIDSTVVARATAGLYPMAEMPGPALAEARRFFHRVPDDPSRMAVDPALQKAVYFRQLNLFDPWPMSGPIDVIFCRNVIIYFSQEDRRTLFDRYARIMAPDGFLYIGHSESIQDDRFELVGRTIYRLRRAG